MKHQTYYNIISFQKKKQSVLLDQWKWYMETLSS